MRIRFALILLLSLSLYDTSRAQFLHSPEASISGSMMIPSGEFSNTLGRSVGWGSTVMGAARLYNSPVYVGLEGSWYAYGLDYSKLQRTHGEYDIFTLNSVSSAHFVMRLQHSVDNYSMYIEGLVGYKWFSTYSFVEYQGRYPSTRTSFDGELLEKFTLSYGVGAGFTVPIYSVHGKPISILAGVRSLRGGRVEYLHSETKSQTGAFGEVEFIPDQSRTDIVTPVLGVTFKM